METYDWNAIVDGLNRYLHLRSDPHRHEAVETVEEMEAIPKDPSPPSQAHDRPDRVAQARQLG